MRSFDTSRCLEQGNDWWVLMMKVEGTKTKVCGGVNPQGRLVYKDRLGNSSPRGLSPSLHQGLWGSLLPSGWWKFQLGGLHPGSWGLQLCGGPSLRGFRKDIGPLGSCAILSFSLHWGPRVEPLLWQGIWSSVGRHSLVALALVIWGVVGGSGGLKRGQAVSYTSGRGIQPLCLAHQVGLSLEKSALGVGAQVVGSAFCVFSRLGASSGGNHGPQTLGLVGVLMYPTIRGDQWLVA